MHRAHRLLFVFVAGLAGCGAGNPSGPSDAAVDSAVAPPDLGGSLCAPQAVPCTDNSIQELALKKKASTRVVENTPDGAGFLSHVDATGGGVDPTESFVYARFTDQGLVRVGVGDEAAFDSSDWDIALRRFVIRLNSGVSGPSCVVGAQLPDNTSYDGLTAVPDGLGLDAETYYDAMCKQVLDSSGIPTPRTCLDGFWRYTTCVQMTGAVFAVRVASGRQVKLTVTAYYDPVSAQQACDDSGTMGGTGGHIRLRWAFLDR